MKYYLDIASVLYPISKEICFLLSNGDLYDHDGAVYQVMHKHLKRDKCLVQCIIFKENEDA